MLYASIIIALVSFYVYKLAKIKFSFALIITSSHFSFYHLDCSVLFTVQNVSFLSAFFLLHLEIEVISVKTIF